MSSGELVSRFYAAWNVDNIASHERAAEEIAGDRAGGDASSPASGRGAPTPTGRARVDGRGFSDEFRQRGSFTDHGPNVSAGANAANPHYEPSADAPRVIRPGEMLLIDLWARETDGGVYADQTWMASLGKPSTEAFEIWNAVRDARDAAIALVRRADARANGRRAAPRSTTPRAA